MVHEFARSSLGKVSPNVFRLGLAASYRPGKKAIQKALDEGVNYLFYFGFDTQMTGVLREVVQKDREKYIVATGAYNYIWTYQNLRRTLEKRLRQLRTDYIDVFHFLGILKRKEFTPQVRAELAELRADPRVRGVAVSCHDRQLAGELAAEGAVDALMIRYNAAHRGAENDIFPHLEHQHPGVVSYTATRWTYLLRRTKSWPKGGRIPDAGMCYRFVLSNPNVDVCLTAPRNLRELEQNLAAVRQGPLPPEEMEFMRTFGDAVYRDHKKFL